MRQDRYDLEQLSKLAFIRRETDMRRLFGNGWKTINDSQRQWIRYMLRVWGYHMRGDESPRGEVNVIGRLMMRCEWSEQKSKQIESTVTELFAQGYRDEELHRRARDIIIPKSAAGNIIALAKESDDAAFMERLITKVLGRDNPIRSMARLKYCRRKSSQDLIRSLSVLTGISAKESRNRIEWAENILDGELYYSSKREMEKEIIYQAA